MLSDSNVQKNSPQDTTRPSSRSATSRQGTPKSGSPQWEVRRSRIPLPRLPSGPSPLVTSNIPPVQPGENGKVEIILAYEKGGSIFSFPETISHKINIQELRKLFQGVARAEREFTMAKYIEKYRISWFRDLQFVCAFIGPQSNAVHDIPACRAAYRGPESDPRMFENVDVDVLARRPGLRLFFVVEPSTRDRENDPVALGTRHIAPSESRRPLEIREPDWSQLTTMSPK